MIRAQKVSDISSSIPTYAYRVFQNERTERKGTKRIIEEIVVKTNPNWYKISYPFRNFHEL